VQDFEEMLAAARLASQQHDAEQEKLVAVAGHDLRSPLTALLLGARYVGRDPSLRDGTRQAAAELEEAAEEVQRKLVDLIDVTRAMHGSLRANLGLIDLAEVATPVAASMKQRAARRGVRIEVHAKPTMARADPRLLERALRDLIDHALHHAAPGSAPVLSIKPVSGGGEVGLRDGKALELEPDLIAHAFDVAPGETAASRRVSGLGLAFVRAAVTTMGGKVWARNESGPALGFWLPAGEP
jgi:signal transduction histidine kinase